MLRRTLITKLADQFRDKGEFCRGETYLFFKDLTARDLLGQTDGRAINGPTIQTPESYLALSLQLYDKERYVESIVASRRALDLRPGYAEAWNNIGAAYNKLGRYEEAAAACEQALRINRTSNWHETTCNTRAGN
jgi:tetratricopeptide (TPR) repeat protein